MALLSVCIPFAAAAANTVPFAVGTFDVALPDDATGKYWVVIEDGPVTDTAEFEGKKFRSVWAEEQDAGTLEDAIRILQGFCDDESSPYVDVYSCPAHRIVRSFTNAHGLRVTEVLLRMQIRAGDSVESRRSTAYVVAGNGGKSLLLHSLYTDGILRSKTKPFLFKLAKDTSQR
jgi:hypothetical protein